MGKMDDCNQIRNTKIQQIFDTMEYGESYEKTDTAIEWIKSVEKSISASPNGTPTQLKNCISEELLCTINVPDIDEIKTIVTKSRKEPQISLTSRAKLCEDLASEIETNADTLAQIEMVARGILAKDTKVKTVPLLAEYFSYYSCFASMYQYENPNWKPPGVIAAVIDNDNYLATLGMVLAPALAAGYNVVLQTGTKLSLAAKFIVDLLTKIAPDSVGVISLIPSDDGELLPYLRSEDVTVLALFADLDNEKYKGINNFHKKILNLLSLKTPMIVFEGADLDSAAESVVEAAWGYQGMLPWSVGTILIQENVFQKFTDKLKTVLSSVKIGGANDKIADISLPNDAELVLKSEERIKKAKSQGIEVFQIENKSGGLAPTLFIGGKADTNNVLTADEKNQAVTLLAFRSIDEAVNLANNTRQGLGASVWSENISLVNEVSRKLKVNNVWVNSHGLVAVDVPLTPIKNSGVGFFGGKEGFEEYVSPQKFSEDANLIEGPTKLNDVLANAVSAAKKAQENWEKTSKINRIKIFQKIANYLRKESSETAVKAISECISGHNIPNYTNSHSGHTVTSLRCPKGVIAIEDGFINQMLWAIFEGNAVLLLLEDNNSRFKTELNNISKMLPNGLLNIFIRSLENRRTLASHKELNCYLSWTEHPIFGSVPIKESKIFAFPHGEYLDTLRGVTVLKNVWSNIGQSSQCNL